jgi:hypothetical protein
MPDTPVKFEGTQAASINYDVPLPTSHTGRRLTFLDLGIDKKEWLNASSSSTPKILEDEALVTKRSDGSLQVDFDKAAAFWKTQAAKVGITSGQAAIAIESKVALAKESTATPIIRSATSPPDSKDELLPGHRPPPSRLDRIPLNPKDPGRTTQTTITGAFSEFIDRLELGELLLPRPGWGGTSYAPQPVPKEPSPALFLVEVYGISSFLGDYGMGRTVKTLTLLPGEELKITMRTWRATAESIATGSSIIDSYNESAVERFSESLQSESSVNTTQSKEESWYVDAEAKGNFGFGSASVSGGGAGEYHSGRDEFAKAIDETTKEHTNEASASREMSVTSSSEVSQETEDETVTERVIRNVNMRRTLNFVFRELNQEFITKTHLREVRIGYTDGLPGSWREAPISGLRPFLESLLKPAAARTAAIGILGLIGVAFDHADNPIATLEQVTMNGNGTSWTVGPARMSGSGFSPPTDKSFYRYKRGPLGQENEKNQVDGVLLKQRTIVVRTDSVAVEALLGQADALDAYAMEVQQAAAETGTLKNERESLAISTLAAIDDPVERAELYARIFNPQPPASS